MNATAIGLKRSIYAMSRLNFVLWIPSDRLKEFYENRLGVRDDLLVHFEFLFHGNGD